MKDELKPNGAASEVDRHFVGRSENVRRIYDAILRAAQRFGTVIEDPKKTSIHLNRNSAFAGVQTRRLSLVLTIKAASDIDHPRIAKSQQASANRWHHEIKIMDPKEIDGTILAWLKQSYELSG